MELATAAGRMSLPSHPDAASREPRWIFRVTVALLLLGVGLRLWQYLGNPSLWIDELALTRNLTDRSLGELLTQPLAYGAAAPVGFLALEKAVTQILGTGELALRLVPLLSALAAFPLLLAVAGRTLPAVARPLVLALFVLAPPLTLRAAEVKPYSSDVLVALAIVLAGLRWAESPSRGRTLVLGLLAALGPWFSLPAIFVAAGVLVALAMTTAERTRLAAAAVPALASLALAAWYAEGMVRGETRAMLFEHWNRGFLPWQFRPALRWLAQAPSQPFQQQDYGLGWAVSQGYAALIPLGWWMLFRRARVAALILATPVLAALLAAAAHLYPFADRMVLFLAPLALLAVAAGLDGVRSGLGGRRWLGPLISLGGIAPALLNAVAHRPVLRRQEARPLLAYLAAHHRSGEPVYAYFTGWQAVEYYAPRVGLEQAQITLGSCDVGRTATYAAELNRFAGAGRLWVFFTHEAVSERSRILGHLDRIGTRELALVVPQWPAEVRPSASLYAYDLRRAPPGLDTVSLRRPNPLCQAQGPLFPVPARLPQTAALP